VKEIAAELCLGERSVERYKGLIMEKMGEDFVGDCAVCDTE
jgi:DNA-binding NarL/FixJ family response regulator